MAQGEFTTNKRIPELDGLRGLAALAVVVAHYFGEVPHGLHVLRVGWIGVDIFFVLSGFLIGSIILEQHSERDFLKTFYLKRAARIIPIYAVICIVTLTVAAITAGHSWSDRPFPPGTYAVFGANLVMSAANSAGDLWLRPTWTLDVEEQFYLVLPVLICVTPRRLLPSLLAALWGSATVVRLGLNLSHPIAALTLLPCRMDLLLAGVGLALLYRSNNNLGAHQLFLRTLPLFALIALFLVRLLFGPEIFTVVGPAISSIGIAGFLAAILCGAPEGHRFRANWLRWFGQISYCLYLVHQPVSGVLHGLLLDSAPDIGTPAAIAVSLLAFSVSVGIAAVSWTMFEQPIMRWMRGATGVPASALA